MTIKLYSWVLLFVAVLFLFITKLPIYIIGNFALVSYDVISESSSTKSSCEIFMILSKL